VMEMSGVVVPTKQTRVSGVGTSFNAWHTSPEPPDSLGAVRILDTIKCILEVTTEICQ
jgi:hypothetical protein